MSDKPLVNRVANSSLITIKLDELLPEQELVKFDIKDYLFQGLILKEKDFRQALKEYDWSQLQDKILLVYCSTDAIIPTWSYMLITAYAEPYTSDIFQGSEEEFYKSFFKNKIEQIEATQYQDARLVIKGCSAPEVPESAYVDMVKKLRPFAQSIMFGEACSAVPIFKRPRKIIK